MLYDIRYNVGTWQAALIRSSEPLTEKNSDFFTHFLISLHLKDIKTIIFRLQTMKTNITISHLIQKYMYGQVSAQQ